MQTKSTVKGATTSEVKNSVGELLNRVILDIDSMMRWLFESAHSHVGNGAAPFSRFGVSQMIGQEPYLLKLIDYVNQKVTLVYSIFSRDNNIHVPTSSSTPSIGATHLDVIQLQRCHHFSNHASDVSKHTSDFVTRYFGLKLRMIFQPDLLIGCQEMSVCVQVGY